VSGIAHKCKQVVRTQSSSTRCLFVRCKPPPVSLPLVVRNIWLRQQETEIG